MAKKNKRSKRKGSKNKRTEDEPKKQANELEVQKPSMAMNPQTDSAFFHRLPQELRNHIYGFLFSSTKFAFGKRPNGRTELPDGTKRVHYVAIKPAPNGLALLRSCRRSRMEIGDSWLPRVQFWFTDVKTMLDRLSHLTPDIVSKIRHMTVGAKQILLRSKHHAGGYHIESAFRLLQGLRLDQLTVFTSGRRSVDSHTIRGLIRHGSGWKTLRYLTFDLPYPVRVFDPAPERSFGASTLRTGWQSDLDDRDGKASSPSVTVYRGKTLGDDNSYEEDWQSKKFMIVVKRGSGIDYQENKVEPRTHVWDRQRTEPMTQEEIMATTMGDHIRWDFPGMTWEQIRDAYPQNRDDELDEIHEDVAGIRSSCQQDVDELDWVLLCHSQE